MNDKVGHQGNNAPEPTTDSLTETELDTLISRFGRAYNRPAGIVPREEMWQAIRPRTGRRQAGRLQSVSLMTAAVVLLAAGIGIGVGLHSHGIVASGNPALASGASQPAAPREVATAPSRNDVEGPYGAEPAPRAPIMAGTAASHPLTGGVLAGSNVGSTPSHAARSTAYSLATVRHFTAVEALLTSYQTTRRDASNDAELAAWARSLLSQTRLLLDSPAGADPIRNKLLQDLELILVQMTQLSPANTSIDRESLDGSMKHSAVITRLRTAVPAGASTTL